MTVPTVYEQVELSYKVYNVRELEGCVQFDGARLLSGAGLPPVGMLAWGQT